MIETIKASGAENGTFERWSGYQASVNTQKVRFLRIDQYLGVLPEAVNTFLNILVLTIGVCMSMRGQFTVGMILAFQAFMQSFLSPALQLVNTGQLIQEMRADMERVEDVMQYPEDPAFAPEESKESKESKESAE